MPWELEPFPAPAPRSGALLVVGSAPCVYEDVEAAASLFPSAPRMGLNYVGATIACELLFTGCALDFPAIRDAVIAGPAGRPEVHVLEYTPQRGPWFDEHVFDIDFHWRGTLSLIGTASMAAAVVARRMGYGPVVLCGAPLERTGHIDGYPVSPKFDPDDPSGRVDLTRGHWTRAREGGHLDGVCSMSGWTAGLLGRPEQERAA